MMPAVEWLLAHAFLQWMQRVSSCLRSKGRFTRDGPADPEPRHLVEQRGARQTKPCSRTFHAAHHPTTVFKRTQDRGAFDLLQSSWKWTKVDSLRLWYRQRIGKL